MSKQPLTKDDLIIRRPHLQSGKAKWSYRLLSLVFWLMFLVTLVAWRFSFWWIQDELGGAATNYFADLAELKFLGMMMLLLGGGLIIWATYNRIRFRGKDRRAHRDPLDTEKLAEYFDSTAIDIFLMHGSQRIVLHLNDEGRITQYDISLPGESPVIIHSEAKNLQRTAA